jgi:methyltransferase (TIGR00027 family)
MPDSLVDHVSDTAFWVAHHRALETARPDALFQDPFAALLAGEHGKKIAGRMPLSPVTNWVVAMRTCIIDRFIATAVAGGVDAVVNLGAGLDARPFRMQLPSSLFWVDVDFPAVIDYKEKILSTETPSCHLQWAKVNLSDAGERRALLARVNHQAKKVLILTEGVIPYLSEANVAALADDLKSLNHIRYWIVDYSSSEAVERRRKSAIWQKMDNAPLLFNPPDWLDFFATHHWLCKDIEYFIDETRRQKRPVPLPWTMKLMARVWGLFAPPQAREAFRKSSGFALLEND